jgi:hypothetical protein
VTFPIKREWDWIPLKLFNISALKAVFCHNPLFFCGSESDMAKAPKPKLKKAPANDVESNAVLLDDLDPDAWPKFEKLIKSAAKMGPKPHNKAQK